MTSRSSTTAPILAVLAVLLSLAIAYAAAYLCIEAKEFTLMFDQEVVAHYRYYRWRWAVIAFQPAVWIEGTLCGAPIELQHDEDFPIH